MRLAGGTGSSACVTAGVPAPGGRSRSTGQTLHAGHGPGSWGKDSAWDKMFLCRATGRGHAPQKTSQQARLIKRIMTSLSTGKPGVTGGDTEEVTGHSGAGWCEERGARRRRGPQGRGRRACAQVLDENELECSRNWEKQKTKTKTDAWGRVSQKKKGAAEAGGGWRGRGRCRGFSPGTARSP